MQLFIYKKVFLKIPFVAHIFTLVFVIFCVQIRPLFEEQWVFKDLQKFDISAKLENLEEMLKK